MIHVANPHIVVGLRLDMLLNLQYAVEAHGTVRFLRCRNSRDGIKSLPYCMRRALIQLKNVVCKSSMVNLASINVQFLSSVYLIITRSLLVKEWYHV